MCIQNKKVPLILVWSDHKPLLALFGECWALPTQASSIIQCWALTLASYKYSLAARPMTQHGNADAMSRLPLKCKPMLTPQPPEFVLTLDNLSQTPITCSQIQTWTRQDPVLSSVLRICTVRLATRVSSRRTETLLV